ncbi:unnamed protein product [Fusarium fujikuroi]|uniref:NAD(P)-binding domain-containing protein n=1 Tax=Fusarium fujikuroi TaxID=5127 RepID=A0A9Q9UD46_FUSFU|nr:unnamed protein product [Fusarium fujikuroi]
MAQTQQVDLAALVPDYATKDTDSSLGEDLQSSSASVSSSILNYRRENGRTYHAYKDGNLQHNLFLLTFDDKVLAYGLSIMRMSTLKLSVPPNVNFVIDDIEDDWTFSQPFDYIHSRVMTSCIADWGDYLKKCFNNLVPGGYLEIQEVDVNIKSDDGSLRPDNIMLKSLALLNEASVMFGRPYLDILSLVNIIKNIDFEDVVVEKFKWPINSWPRDKKAKLLGSWCYTNMACGLEAFTMAPLTRAHGWTPEEASGNFGTPITAALIKAGFDVTIITRNESKSTFPDGIPVIRTDYTLDALTQALHGQDAVACVVGPAGIPLQATMIDAALAAGVKRFIVDDYGWGPEFRSYPEFEAVRAQRTVGVDRAKEHAGANPDFTWTSIATGNPIDWALKRFPTMGFDIKNRTAIIYDQGEGYFTGTTLQGIGQSVLGVLQHPDETANQHVKVLSIKTCQNELLEAFQKGTGIEWDVQRRTTSELIDGARKKRDTGEGGWILDLAVAQLYEVAEGGKARCLVASSWEESDSGLLGVTQETPESIVTSVLASI